MNWQRPYRLNLECLSCFPSNAPYWASINHHRAVEKWLVAHGHSTVTTSTQSPWNTSSEHRTEQSCVNNRRNRPTESIFRKDIHSNSAFESIDFSSADDVLRVILWMTHCLIIVTPENVPWVFASQLTDREFSQMGFWRGRLDLRIFFCELTLIGHPNFSIRTVHLVHCSTFWALGCGHNADIDVGSFRRNQDAVVMLDTSVYESNIRQGAIGWDSVKVSVSLISLNFPLLSVDTVARGNANASV
jgi:hypothetical protein